MPIGVSVFLCADTPNPKIIQTQALLDRHLEFYVV